MRSSLLERGAAVEVALGPLDRAALAAVAQRAAGRPLPPGALAVDRALGGGQPVLRGGARGVGGRLRRGHGAAAAARGRGAAARAARAARRAAAGRARRDRRRLHGRGARGTRGLRGRRRGARRGRGGRRARECARPLSLPARARARGAGRPAARGGAAPHARATPPRCSPRTTRLPRASRTTCCAPVAGGRRCRCSRGRPSGPRAWAPTATAPSGPSWRSRTRTSSERPALLALRAQLLHGAGEADAPAAYAEAIDVAPAERVPALRAQQARACLAAGDVAGRRGRARRACRPSGPRTSASLILLRGMVAWHVGDWEGARRLAAEADRLAPDPGELAA